jgi:hypothetical protein
MVGASDEVQLVALMRAYKRATTVLAADAGSVALFAHGTSATV